MFEFFLGYMLGSDTVKKDGQNFKRPYPIETKDLLVLIVSILLSFFLVGYVADFIGVDNFFATNPEDQRTIVQLSNELLNIVSHFIIGFIMLLLFLPLFDKIISIGEAKE